MKKTLDIEDKRLCFECVDESFLKKEIESKGKRLKCSYCETVTKCYLINQVAERIDSAFSAHYVLSSDQPTDYQYAMMKDKESFYEWDRDGEPVIDAIMNAAEIPEEAAKDIQEILQEKYADRGRIEIGEECEYDSGTYYEAKSVSDEYWQEEWKNFEQNLKKKSRFFSRACANHLESIFDGIDKMTAWDNKPLIVNGGPGTKYKFLYRARVFQSNDKLKIALKRPEQELGSPPFTYAIPGRMNARGISVFYGANHPKVALSEVRPPVGSKVAIARFKINKAINLLDLTSLGKVTSKGSIFDETYSKHLEKAMFLRNLAQRITVPVMPEHEEFEYLVTQAIADFLSGFKIDIDGIIYPSVQVQGKKVNVVLFHKAALVKEIVLPDSTNIKVQLEDFGDEGPYPSFTVWEEFDEQTDNQNDEKTTIKESFMDWNFSRENADDRKPTLKIDLESIKVHLIKSVQYLAEQHMVNRFRHKKVNFNKRTPGELNDW